MLLGSAPAHAGLLASRRGNDGPVNQIDLDVFGLLTVWVENRKAVNEQQIVESHLHWHRGLCTTALSCVQSSMSSRCLD